MRFCSRLLKVKPAIPPGATKVRLLRPGSVKRYSTLTLQFGVKAYSTPAPAAYPKRVLLALAAVKQVGTPPMVPRIVFGQAFAVAAKGHAACAVNQEAVDGDAGAAANGARESLYCYHNCRSRRSRCCYCCCLTVAFNTDHELFESAVKSCLATANG